MRAPPVRYARSGETRIAYQVAGTGELDVAVLAGPGSAMELLWEQPRTAEYLERLCRFARVILHDRRGMGVSDPCERPPTFEQQVDDVIAVLDAAGSSRAAVLGTADAARLAALVGAMHPLRVQALVLYQLSPEGILVSSPGLAQPLLDAIENSWGTGSTASLVAPSLADDAAFCEWWGRYERTAASPRMARMVLEMSLRSDITDVLPTIRVPTLVAHRREDPMVPIDVARRAAAQIPEARFVELPGREPLIYAESPDPFLDEVEQFLTGIRRAPVADRVLATVLFTDIVASTERAAALGDHRWRELLDRHDELVRRHLARFGGREVKTTGDGFLAVFEGPARAVACADSLTRAMRPLGLEVRAGVHTGECERRGQDVGGIAVHIGARIMSLAAPGEVLVSSTVKDLVIGSGLSFEERGTHRLRGAPDEWRLYALAV
jgi:class 3 adenylate cyclase